MAAVVQSIAVRLELTTRSVPPVPPIDSNTGEIPAVWRGEDWAFQIGIFDANGVGVDLSNIDYLQVDIYHELIPATWPATNQTYSPYSTLPFPSTPPSPLLSTTIVKADITPIVSYAAWKNGSAQQATANFRFTDTNSINLNGYPKRTLGIMIFGYSNGQKKLTYVGGPWQVFEGGDQTVYLPNNIAPIIVPENTVLYVFPDQQLVYTLPITVNGSLKIEGSLIQVPAY